MKGKFKKLLLLLALSVGVCGVASACKDKSDSSISDGGSSGVSSEEILPSFALKYAELNLDVYEKYDLEYTLSNLSGEIVWTSSATDVVSVSGGSLEAKSVGVATVTATIGGYSDECIVKVVNNNSIPTLSVAEKISVEKGATTSADISVLWKGKQLDVPLSCEFESGDEAVADVSIVDGKVVVKGLACGEAKYLLKAETHDTLLVTRFEVKCINGAATFVVENANPTIGGWYAEVALCDNENGVPVSFKPQVSVYENNEKVPDAKIDWTLNEGKNFREDGGAYYANYLGTQSLTGVYEGIEIVITLQSIRPDFVRNDALALEMVDGAIAPNDIEGDEVDGYYVNGVNVFESYDAESRLVTFKQSALSDPSQMGDGVEIILQTNRARYYYQGSVYTNVIRTETELNRWVEDAKAATTGTNASGYFILGNDIVCTGEYKAQETYTFGVSASDGFQGIFDGCGYTIKNLNVTGDMCGFMPMIGENGTVCNIVFENATLSGNGGFIASHLRGTVSNLYIDIAVEDNDAFATDNSHKNDRRYCRSIIGSQCESTTKVRDCAIVYRTTVGEDKATGHPFKWLYGSVTGFYVIGHTSFAAFDDKSQESNSAKNNFGLYATRDDMIADLKNWNKDGHTWNESFWTTDEDGIPVPIKK